MANIIKVGGGGLPFKEVAFASYHWNGQIGNIYSGIILKKDKTVLVSVNEYTVQGDYFKLETYNSSSKKETDVIALKSGKYYYKVARGKTITEATVTVNSGSQIVRVNGWTSSNDQVCVIAL